MATVEGLLVLSSLRKGVNANEGHATSPSTCIGIINATALIITIGRPGDQLLIKNMITDYVFEVCFHGIGILHTMHVCLYL